MRDCFFCEAPSACCFIFAARSRELWNLRQLWSLLDNMWRSPGSLHNKLNNWNAAKIPDDHGLCPVTFCTTVSKMSSRSMCNDSFLSIGVTVQSFKSKLFSTCPIPCAFTYFTTKKNPKTDKTKSLHLTSTLMCDWHELCHDWTQSQQKIKTLFFLLLIFSIKTQTTGADLPCI